MSWEITFTVSSCMRTIPQLREQVRMRFVYIYQPTIIRLRHQWAQAECDKKSDNYKTSLSSSRSNREVPCSATCLEAKQQHAEISRPHVSRIMLLHDSVVYFQCPDLTCYRYVYHRLVALASLNFVFAASLRKLV